MKKLFPLAAILALLIPSCSGDRTEARWLGGPDPSIVLYTYDKEQGLQPADTLIRGLGVDALVDAGISSGGEEYIPVKAGNRKLYVRKTLLAASLEEAVAEKIIYVQTAASLIDDPETVCAALPVLLRSFEPFLARITRLHLCAFWPTREVGFAALTGEE